MTGFAPALDLHGSAVVLGEAGILLRGPSGSGKTAIALALVAAADDRGGFARLVGDDRVLTSPRGDRLIARPHPALAGFAERRGLGIVAVPHEPACVLVLVVDIEACPPRLPEPSAQSCEVAGVSLRRLAVPRGMPPTEAAALIAAALTSSPAVL